MLSAATAAVSAVGGAYSLWGYLDGRKGLILAILSFANCAICTYNGRRLKKIGIIEARKAAGECPACGYDLTGNVSGTCPECGGEGRMKR
jgi:hypothetical protein